MNRVGLSCAHAAGAALGGRPLDRRSDRMGNYRDNWFNVGAVLAMAIVGALAISHRRLSRSRLFSALNLTALMVHQFEEYGFPGYFPGLLNAGVFKSGKPDRYPLNTNSALIVNAAVSYRSTYSPCSSRN